MPMPTVGAISTASESAKRTSAAGQNDSSASHARPSVGKSAKIPGTRSAYAPTASSSQA